MTPIFNTSCGGGEICHGGGINFGDSGPNPPWPWSALVNVKPQRAQDQCSTAGVIVKPSDLADSYLVKKLTGIDICPGSSQMPLGSSLPKTEIQTIVDWICEGAQND